jgi:serine/threonine protein kinase
LLFLIQERITGGELFAAFADETISVSERCISDVGEQLLQALRYLHDRLIVHRDIKAENVLLKSRPSETQEWNIKLIDFGLAMRLESDRALFGSCHEPDMVSQDICCGTLYYCAPEVFAHAYGPKVDVWAVGVMLYLALFGAYPYYDRNPDAMEALICDRDVEPAWEPACAEANPEYEVSEAAQEALCALLDKDCFERPNAKEALKESWYQDSQSTDEIPMAVRKKASRTAARAPVSKKKE